MATKQIGDCRPQIRKRRATGPALWFLKDGATVYAHKGAEHRRVSLEDGGQDKLVWATPPKSKENIACEDSAKATKKKGRK